MSEQQSQKRGVRSDSQKLDDAREGYDAMGSTSPQDGAFGKQTRKRSGGNWSIFIAMSIPFPPNKI